MDYPKLVNCSPNDIEKAVRKLGGFFVNEASSKHIKIIHSRTNKAWMIPRMKPLKRGLVWDFVRNYLQKEVGFTEKQIFEVLWC